MEEKVLSRAALRRSHKSGSLQKGSLVINMETMTVTFRGKELDLSNKEYQLLRYFMLNDVGIAALPAVADFPEGAYFPKLRMSLHKLRIPGDFSLGTATHDFAYRRGEARGPVAFRIAMIFIGADIGIFTIENGHQRWKCYFTFVVL